jgi:hypothetical protein
MEAMIPFSVIVCSVAGAAGLGVGLLGTLGVEEELLLLLLVVLAAAVVGLRTLVAAVMVRSAAHTSVSVPWKSSSV